jgi:hypothetical protein
MVSNEGRAKLRQLGREIRVVADFGRPYRCVYHRRGYYTFEDWISFTETYSLLLLRHDDILEPRVSDPLLLHARRSCSMWCRAGVLHEAQ